MVKAIASFANAKGGLLVIGVEESPGVRDQRKIIGIEDDYNLVGGSRDRYSLYLQDLISKRIPDASNGVEIRFDKVSSKTVCMVEVFPSVSAVMMNEPVDRGEKEVFYCRTNAKTESYEGKRLLEYCRKRFNL